MAGDLNLASGTFAYEVNTSNSTADLVYATGAGVTLNLSGTTALNLTDFSGTNTVLLNGTKFTLISYNDGWDLGTFAGLADDSTFTAAGNEWVINYNDAGYGTNFQSEATSNGTSFVTITVIPEPNVAALLGGVGALALLRRRRA